MQKSEYQTLAKAFLAAVKATPDRTLWIKYSGAGALPLAKACAEEMKNIGGKVSLWDNGAEELNKNLSSMSKKEIREWIKTKHDIISGAKSFISITDDADQLKLNVSDQKYKIYQAALRPMLTHIVENSDWLVLAAPTKEFAKACGMTKRQFDNFYKKSCMVDYDKMAKAAAALEKLLGEGKKLRFVGHC